MRSSVAVCAAAAVVSGMLGACRGLRVAGDDSARLTFDERAVSDAGEECVRSSTGALPPGISSVRVSVFDGAGAALVTVTKSILDTAGGIDVVDLPAGSDRTIRFEGLSAQEPPEIVWRAEARGVTTGAGELVRVPLYATRVGAETLVCARMNRGTFAHTATALDDGRVLIAGGFSALSVVGSCGANCQLLVATARAEAYDPTRGTFTVLPSMTAQRALHAATRLADGRVLVAGGTSSGRLTTLAPTLREAIVGADGGVGGATGTAFAEVYDPVANRWSAVPLDVSLGSQPSAVLPVAVALSAGAVIAGGQDALGAASAARYLFTPAGALSLASSMVVARAEFVAVRVVTDGGEFLASIGGTESVDAPEIEGTIVGADGAPDGGTPLDASVPELLHGASSVAQSVRVFDIAGGSVASLASTALAIALRFDFADALGAAPRVVDAGLSAPRAFTAAARLPDGGLLVAGGVSDTTLVPLASMDALFGALESPPALVRARFSHTATTLHDGTILFIGGLTVDGGAFLISDEAEVYNSTR